MCQLKLLIVPHWLNLVMKELELTYADLLDVEKLSGILSPRDLLIYKMIHFNMAEFLNMMDLKACHADFRSPLPTPVPMEIAACANIPITQMFYGATVANEVPDFLYEIKAVAPDTVAILVSPPGQQHPGREDDTRPITQVLAQVMHGMMELKDLAKTQSFARYIGGVQVSPVSY